MEEFPPQIVPPRAISYSQYSIWANCPWQWKLKYVDGIRPEDRSINLVFGTAMHEVIQEWLSKHFQDEKRARRIDLNPSFKEKLTKYFLEESPVGADGSRQFLCDKQTLQEYYNDGCQILNHVQKYAADFFPSKGYKLIGCEIPLEVTLPNGVLFKGFIDIGIHDTIKDEYHIIDLKTSKSGWWKYQKTDDKKINQVLLYKHFFSKQYNIDPEKIFPRFIILKRKIIENSDFIIRRLSNFEPSHGKISMNRAQSSLENFLHECFTEEGAIRSDVNPTPSKSACRYCPYLNTQHCSVGIASE